MQNVEDSWPKEYDPSRPLYPELRLCRVSFVGKKKTVYWHTYYGKVHIFGHYDKNGQAVVERIQEEPESFITGR